MNGILLAIRWARVLSGPARVFLLTLTCCLGPAALAEVALPSIFSDHMVLQRDEALPVWGFANPGEAVKVALADQTLDTVADDAGKWRVSLEPMPAGGPYTLTVTGANTVTLQDVYVGEVWLCSGQSNMQWTVANSANAQQEIADAQWPKIRMYTARHTTAAEPQRDVAGHWDVCSPETVGEFSAVGYFFGRDLYEELDVPIGLVHSSWGGTRAEPWVPREALAEHPDYAKQIEQIDAIKAAYRQDREKQDQRYREARRAYRSQVADWNRQLMESGRGFEQGWTKGVTDDQAWQTVNVPGPWSESDAQPLQNFDGVVWMARQVDIPEGWAGRDLTLTLGAIDDYDQTYFNGELIGRTGTHTPFAWQRPRVYQIPGNQVTAGKANIVVRVVDTGIVGGILGGPNGISLAPTGDPEDHPIDLKGTWHYRIDFPMSDMPPSPTPPINPASVGTSVTSPSAIYNGMLHPLVPYAIRGVIWYQGESNAGQARAYRELLPLLIHSWRTIWHKPDMPFGIVQLANFTAPQPEPGDNAWARLRDAQLNTFETVPHTGLAVTIDIGEANNIHPKNKQEVGRRLALWAMATVYGRDDLVWSGPIYKAMRIEDGKVYLSFDHAEDGLKTSDGKAPAEFAIAGADGKFVWAKAKVDGDQVVVWNPDVPEPVTVRYAWAANPDKANLTNAAGLPASPFNAAAP